MTVLVFSMCTSFMFFLSLFLIIRKIKQYTIMDEYRKYPDPDNPDPGGDGGGPSNPDNPDPGGDEEIKK